MPPESMVGRSFSEEGELKPGTSLHHYTIDRVLGRGGFGITYLVSDLRNNELSVLKAVLPDRFLDRSSIDGFYKESTRLLQISPHPNIVPIRFSWIERETNTPYFLMDYIPGGDLWSFVKDGNKPTIYDCWWVLLNLIMGMRFLSEDVHIVHRDLKPQNMLIDQDGIIKISDFGLAKVDNFWRKVIDPTARVGQSGAAGTLHFMSPEQIRGEEVVDCRSDMWSIGVSLYWLSTGRLPFKGLEVEKEILNREPTAPSANNPNIDKALESIILRCLEKDAAKRYGSFSELEATAMISAMEISDFFTKVATETCLVSIDAVRDFLIPYFDPDRARQVPSEELAPDGSDWLSYVQRIYVLITIHNLDEAQRMVEDALAHDPDHPIVLCYRAMILGAKGHHDEAARAFEELFEHKDPKNRKPPAIAYQEAINFYISTGQYERGRSVERCAEERLAAETDPKYRQHFADTISDAISRLHHDVDQTIADKFGIDVDFDSLFDEIADQASPELNQLSVAKMCKHAITLAERGLFEPALEIFETAVQRSPDYGAAWADLGTCLMEMERYSESFEALQRASQLIPNDFITWYYLAMVSEQLGKMEESLKYYDQALKLEPDNGEAWLYKGSLLAEEFEDYRTALTCFEHAQRLGHPKAEEMIDLTRNLLDQR